MAALFALLALALAQTVSGKRLCDNEHVHLDFGPDKSFIASFKQDPCLKSNEFQN